MNKNKTLYDLIKEDIKETYKSTIKEPTKKIVKKTKDTLQNKHTYDLMKTYLTSTLKSVAIGWLPSKIRPEVEEKVLSDLEKELLYKGKVLKNYNLTDHKTGTKIYKTGDISTFVNGLTFGTYVGSQIPNTLAGIALGTFLASASILTRYIANIDVKSCQIITKNGHIKEHVPVAGNIFSKLPVSVAVNTYKKNDLLPRPKGRGILGSGMM